jgi:hypothetical protein
MAARNLRRHRRLAFSGYIDISWTDPRGQVKYARTKCLDVSEMGVRVEAPEPIPERTSVSLRAERLSVSGGATVRHVVRLGAKFILGLELTASIAEKALSGVEELKSGPAR